MSAKRGRDSASRVFAQSLAHKNHPAPPVSLDSGEQFTVTVVTTLQTCTVANVQLCKNFIIKNILPSNERTSAWIRYFVKLACSYPPQRPAWDRNDQYLDELAEGIDMGPDGRSPSAIPPERKRLHLLMIVSDVLVGLQESLSPAADRNKPAGKAGLVTINLPANHSASVAVTLPADIVSQILLQLKPLVELVACRGKEPRKGNTLKCTFVAIKNIIVLWNKQHVFNSSVLADQFMEIVLRHNHKSHEMDFSDLDAFNDLRSSVLSDVRERKPLGNGPKQRTIPDRHGRPSDPNAPWNALPAANALFMKRTLGYPMFASAMPKGGYPIPEAGKHPYPPAS